MGILNRAAVGAVGASGVALAQPFSATLTFEASTDGGTTWRAGEVVLEPVAQSVLIRLRADWEPGAGYAFARGTMDIVIRDASGADTAGNFVRPRPFDAAPQNIAATRFGSLIKVDDSRDTLPPDHGTRGVTMLQVQEEFNPDFDRSQPATIFLFDFGSDGVAGTRTVDALVVRPPNPPLERFIEIYATQRPPIVNRAIASVEVLRITVVPAPGAFALLTSALLVTARQRRGTR